MEPNAFVAEVYRRMSLRTNIASRVPPTPARISAVAHEYRSFLPIDKTASILDIGFGDGWFLGACRQLEYSNLAGAEFNPGTRPYLREWGVTLYKIDTDIGAFLKDHPEEYDFIHMSHVIEHIPKYSLLWIVDSLYRALRRGGTLLLRTPNMESPAANSSYYVTLAHEYGFAGSNLQSLLKICGFDDVTFQQMQPPAVTLKQKVGILVRWPYLIESRIRHRLFGVNSGGQFGSELIVTGRRGDFPTLFDSKFR
jgi:SAM-dependent methyltransferase